MWEQKGLLALTVAVCVFGAISTWLALVLTRDDLLSNVLLNSGLYLLPGAAAFWLSRRLQRPIAGT